jgi:hypothetical protein
VDFVAERLKMCSQQFFVTESGVIGADGDFH